MVCLIMKHYTAMILIGEIMTSGWIMKIMMTMMVMMITEMITEMTIMMMTMEMIMMTIIMTRNMLNLMQGLTTSLILLIEISIQELLILDWDQILPMTIDLTMWLECIIQAMKKKLMAQDIFLEVLQQI